MNKVLDLFTSLAISLIVVTGSLLIAKRIAQWGAKRLNTFIAYFALFCALAVLSIGFSVSLIYCALTWDLLFVRYVMIIDVTSK